MGVIVSTGEGASTCSFEKPVPAVDPVRVFWWSAYLTPAGPGWAGW